MVKTVAVTGATGFIAVELVKQLLEKGYNVRGTHRPGASSEKITPLKKLAAALPGQLELFEADLEAPGAFDAAIHGVDYVFHTASAVKLHADDPVKEIINPAVNGTRNVLSSCLKSKDTIQRIVVTSSAAAVRSTKRPAPPVHGDVYSDADFNDSSVLEEEPYFVAKSRAERLAWEFSKEHGMDLVVINPTFVVGPAISTAAISGMRLLLEYLEGRSATLSVGNGGVIDVRDVARAHVLAVENPNAKGRYLLTHEHKVSSSCIVKALQKRFPQLHLKLDNSADDNKGERLFDNSKTTNQLGVQLRSIEETFIDAVSTLIQLGAAKPVMKS